MISNPKVKIVIKTRIEAGPMTSEPRKNTEIKKIQNNTNSIYTIYVGVKKITMIIQAQS